MTNLFVPAATWVTTRDHHLMQRVNHWPAPRWLRVWMLASTRGGDGWLWLGISLLVALFGGPQRSHALAASWLAVGAGVALFMKLKRTIGRKRPCELEPHCWAKLLPPDQFSFPSGHTMTAFAAAVSISAFYPALSPELFFCAASIYLAHYARDAFLKRCAGRHSARACRASWLWRLLAGKTAVGNSVDTRVYSDTSASGEFLA